MNKDVLYPLQESVFERLIAMRDPQLSVAKLCGGTALARFWLDHRISFDLDFFLPHGFMALELAVAMKKAGIEYVQKDIVDDPRKANQLHGYVIHDGASLKVSFVEDAYFELFPAVKKPLGQSIALTEAIPALYHRKLRTVSGGGAEGESFEGGRQKARDLFDLHVLSVEFQPIRKFMASLPYEFPSNAFDNGLANMPWFDLMDELGEIVCAEQWVQAKSIEFLQNALFEQIGAKALVDELNVLQPPPVPMKTVRLRNRGPGRNNGGASR